MTRGHDVIQAFIDNEPFDAAALAESLSTAEGRALLIDLVALRDLAQPEELPADARPARAAGTTSPLLWIAAAATVFLAGLGGYRLGTRSDSGTAVPPAPTVVFKATAWVDAQGATR
jgi:hypothetical protein